MSSLLDDVDQKCNEMMEMAVQSTKLNIFLKYDLTIYVGFREFLQEAEFAFYVDTPDTAREIHSRVFATLARIVGGHGLSNVAEVQIELPQTNSLEYYTQTPEMTPFIQSIAGSSTIQRLHVTGMTIPDSVSREIETHHNNIVGPTDDVRLFWAAGANLASPQSVLKKLHLDEIHFDNERLGTLCELLSSTQCRLVKLNLDHCYFPTVGPLWSAMQVNQSIENLWVVEPMCNGEPPIDFYGSQQFQSMLESNRTMLELSFSADEEPECPNSFFTAYGAGLVSNTTLKILDLSGHYPFYGGKLNALFKGGLNRNTSVEKLGLCPNDLSEAQDVVSGIDRMAKNISTKRSVDGSHRASTLKHLHFRFGEEANVEECIGLLLDCLIRNRACFAFEELYFDCIHGTSTDDTDLFVKMAAFIQAFPTTAVLTMDRYKRPTDDSNLTLLADALENNTMMTEFHLGGLKTSDDMSQRNKQSMWNKWSPADNPNRTRIFGSVLRNKRELPVFLESSRRSLLPLVLTALLEPMESKVVQVVNLSHAFHLLQNLPELFSTGGGSGGGGGKKVESVEN